MSHSTLQQATQARRSVYALNKTLPLPAAEVISIVEHALLHSPSAFHSQSSRAVVLLGAEHDRLWQITAQTLQAALAPEQQAATAEKMARFQAAAGTVLFFEDQSVVQGLQAKYPSYADNFPIWSEQAGAMLQYAIWTALAAAGAGANLQHYNPLIDEAVARQWALPAHWRLRAQLVFGGIAAAPGEKTFAPVAERLKVFGA